MYEAGRESAKDRPSSYLWVVCFFYNGGLSQEEDGASAPLPLNKADFTDEHGVFDGKAYLRAVREGAQSGELDIPREQGLRVRPVHVKLSRLVARRAAEAQVADASQMRELPDHIPFNRQPAWKVSLWQEYWSGVADERDRRSRLR